MKFLFIGIGSIAIISTLLPLIKKDVWWIRIHDFPRFQVIVLGIVSLAGYFLYLDLNVLADDIFLIILVACVIYQINTIYPYTKFCKKQVKKSKEHSTDNCVTLLIANVLMDNRKSKKLLQIINKANPDIVCTVETDSWWQNQLSVLEKDYPNTVQIPLDNTYGMLFYSRLELSKYKIKYLVEDEIPSIHACIKLPSGQYFNLFCLHPTPPVPGENTRSTERDAELLQIGKIAKESKFPAIVAGDLNDVAWSYTTRLFQKISGLLDPRIGRGTYSTFHAKYPFFRWPLDHIFHSNHFKLVALERLPYFGSDHFPICIKLSLEPEESYEQPEPHADQEEKEEAEEKIEKVDKV